MLLLLLACRPHSPTPTPTPREVVEALVAAARADEVTAIGRLCSTEVERDVELHNICALGGIGGFVESYNGVLRPQPAEKTAELAVMYRENFVRVFENVTVEQSSIVDANLARVTGQSVMPDGSPIRFDIVVERHQERWYLSRLEQPAPQHGPAPG